MRQLLQRLQIDGERRRNNSRGQSLVEFALVVIPMMLLLLGAIQFGVIWAAQIGVTNVVRDTARAASGVQPKDASGTVTSAVEQSYADSLKACLLADSKLAAIVPFFGSGNVQSRTICYTTFEDASDGTSLEATVSVTYGHPIFIPFLAGVLGKSTISTTSSLSIPVGLDPPFTLPSVGSKTCTSSSS